MWFHLCQNSEGIRWEKGRTPEPIRQWPTRFIPSFCKWCSLLEYCPSSGTKRLFLNLLIEFCWFSFGFCCPPRTGLYISNRCAVHLNLSHAFITYLTPCRYLGLQVGYKVMGIILLMILGWKAHRTEEYSLADDKKDHSDCPAGKQGDPNLLKLCCGVKRWVKLSVEGIHSQDGPALWPQFL